MVPTVVHQQPNRRLSGAPRKQGSQHRIFDPYQGQAALARDGDATMRRFGVTPDGDGIALSGQSEMERVAR